MPLYLKETRPSIVTVSGLATSNPADFRGIIIRTNKAADIDVLLRDGGAAGAILFEFGCLGEDAYNGFLLSWNEKIDFLTDIYVDFTSGTGTGSVNILHRKSYNN